MDHTLSQLTSLIPAEIDLQLMAKFIVLIIAGFLILSLIVRMIFGRRSQLNHAVSSAMGILLIYVVTVVVYTFDPGNLSRFLTPLPLVEFSQDHFYILSFQDATTQVLCAEFLSLLILAFLVNLIDNFIPKGKSAVKWYLLRFLSVIVAMGLHYAFHAATHAFVPDLLVTYGPMIILGVLIGALVLGVVNALLSLVLTVVNPILGGIYTFFFSNTLGKGLSKSILTAGLVLAVFYALTHFGFGVICISVDALISYFPLLFALLLLWYLTGHLL